MSIRPEVLEMFVHFVRMNPWLAADDRCIPLVFAAYEEHVPVRPEFGPPVPVPDPA